MPFEVFHQWLQIKYQKLNTFLYHTTGCVTHPVTFNKIKIRIPYLSISTTLDLQLNLYGTENWNILIFPKEGSKGNNSLLLIRHSIEERQKKTNL